MVSGVYKLELFCDSGLACERDARPEEGWSPAATYYGQTREECRQQARRGGWKLRAQDGYAACPECVKAHESRPKGD